jgi:hypothetical protein
MGPTHLTFGKLGVEVYLEWEARRQLPNPNLLDQREETEVVGPLIQRRPCRDRDEIELGQLSSHRQIFLIDGRLIPCIVVFR